MGYIWVDDDDMKNTPQVVTINPRTVERTSFACPTIFDMRGTEGTSYYFRLRHGGWRFENEDTGEILVSGTAPNGLDGVCDLDEAFDMIRSEGINIVMGEWS